MENIESLDPHSLDAHADMPGSRLDGDGFGDSFGRKYNQYHQLQMILAGYIYG